MLSTQDVRLNEEIIRDAVAGNQAAMNALYQLVSHISDLEAHLRELGFPPAEPAQNWTLP